MFYLLYFILMCITILSSILLVLNIEFQIVFMFICIQQTHITTYTTILNYLCLQYRYTTIQVALYKCTFLCLSTLLISESYKLRLYMNKCAMLIRLSSLMLMTSVTVSCRRVTAIHLASMDDKITHSMAQKQNDSKQILTY